MFLTVIVFLIILSILVLIHELGHFFAAKKFGIKVEEFGFGLPPRLFGIKKGETMYSINWLPIGGFVKLYGEDEAGAGRPVLSSKYKVSSIKKDKILNTKYKIHNTSVERAFFARPIWQRAVVVVAGVLMNFLLSVVIISYIFGVAGVRVPGDKVIVTDVVKGSPAGVAGIREGDVVEAINGIKITSTEKLINITKEHLSREITLQVKSKKAKIKNIKLIPRKNYPKTEGPMGVAISQNVELKKYPWYEAPIIGTKEALNTSRLLVLGLGKLGYNLVTQGKAPEGVAGPVGIAQLTGQFVEKGPVAVLSFMAILSLNLAILNILPIPALDGGRLFFILTEGIIGKKISSRVEATAHAIGMAILLGLIAAITLNDIIRIFSGQPFIPKP